MGIFTTNAFKIEYLQGPSGAWYYKVKNRLNGQTLTTSETYSTKSNAKRAAKSFVAGLSR